MFHYANSYSLAKRLGAKLYVAKYGDLESRSYSREEREFALDSFNIIYDRIIDFWEYESDYKP